MKYIIKKGADSAVLTEATREELLVLSAVAISEEGLSGEEAARLTGVSKARAVSAIALWTEAGVIAPMTEESAEKPSDDSIEEEFSERVQPGELYEERSVKIAEAIRDEELSELLSECASLMEKPALTTQEVKIITSVYTQYALTQDYLLTLAANLASLGKLTAPRLRDKAISLVGKNIDTTESLEVYLKDKESEARDEQEIRRTLGIWSRKITEAEREAFNKWTVNFGYSTVIIGEAYSVCVNNTGRLSVSYMDKVLTGWHSMGLKTVEECRAAKAISKTEGEEKPKRSSEKSEPPKPRYGDFDIDDAFKKALMRSYEENK